MITWKNILHYAVSDNPIPDKRVEKTTEEWRKILTPEQFRITRQKGTERPFSGELCSIFEEGTYSCICCDTHLFDSTIKFNSSSGWPSFTQPLKENAIKYDVVCSELYFFREKNSVFLRESTLRTSALR